MHLLLKNAPVKPSALSSHLLRYILLTSPLTFCQSLPWSQTSTTSQQAAHTSSMAAQHICTAAHTNIPLTSHFSPKQPQTTTCQYRQPSDLKSDARQSWRTASSVMWKQSRGGRASPVPGVTLPLLGRLPVIVSDTPRCLYHGSPCF